MGIKSNIEHVMTSIMQRSSEELFAKAEGELEDYWHYRKDSTKSQEWNLYQFCSMLELYRGFCRRWEEHHNGSCCVVERVRDKYLMPKIKEFLAENS